MIKNEPLLNVEDEVPELEAAELDAVKEEEKKLDCDVVCEGLEQIRKKFGHGSTQEYVYFITDDDGATVKIGESGSFEARLSNLQTANHRDLLVLHRYECNAARPCETALHHLFAPVRKRGEWFRLTEAHMTLIKAILRPKKREATELAPDDDEENEQQRAIKRRKLVFNEFVRLFEDAVPEKAIRDLVHAQLQLRPHLSANDYLPSHTTRQRLLKQRRPAVSEIDVRKQLATRFDRIGVDDPDEQQKLVRLLQYRLFAKSGWKPILPLTTPSAQSIVANLQELYDAELHSLMNTLSAELGLPSVLPMLAGNKAHQKLCEQAQAKLEEEQCKVLPFPPHAGFIRLRVTYDVFSKKADRLLGLCAEIGRLIGARAIRTKNPARAVRTVYSAVYGLYLKRKQNTLHCYRLNFDDKVLSWLRDFEDFITAPSH